jgi:8-oxo-dGTP pyrophosphatase MutT (NUDIX family)
MSGWKTMSSKVVYDNPWMTVYEDQVVMPNGEDGTYGFVSSKSDGVFVIPIDDQGNTYILSQEHYTARRPMWQFVGGRTDNQAMEVAAKRELLEEMAMDARTITPLATLQSSVGLTTFKITYSLARGITHSQVATDPEEGILEIKKVSFSEVEEMIMAGEIESAESIALFHLAKTYLEHQKNSPPAQGIP